ncbi:MAG: hypothetical protein AAF657_22585 [Acidobacteriota bacterium]
MTTRETFHAESLAVLRREIPEDLEWIPWSELPALRWRDDDTPVDPIVPRGWLVGAALRGDSEPVAEMRQRAALLHHGDAAALGHWLLRCWIEHDTAKTELTEARLTELRGIAERAAALAQSMGRGGTDAEERFQQLVGQERQRPEPTAMPHQGLLAIVAACADRAIAADIEQYLASYQTERPAQCQALSRLVSS